MAALTFRTAPKLKNQAREMPREFVKREIHYVWGRRYLLNIEYVDTKLSVQLEPHRVTLTVRPGSDAALHAAYPIN
jgi:hypothetical protein